VKIQLIIHSSNTFGFYTAFKIPTAYFDRITACLFSKMTEPGKGITIYLNQEKNIHSFDPGITRMVEIESFKDRLTLIRQRKS
jgi:hypothetical protein